MISKTPAEFRRGLVCIRIINFYEIIFLLWLKKQRYLILSIQLNLSAIYSYTNILWLRLYPIFFLYEPLLNHFTSLLCVYSNIFTYKWQYITINKPVCPDGFLTLNQYFGFVCAADRTRTGIVMLPRNSISALSAVNTPERNVYKAYICD